MGKRHHTCHVGCEGHTQSAGLIGNCFDQKKMQSLDSNVARNSYFELRKSTCTPFFSNCLFWVYFYQASHRMKTPVKYMTGTTVLPFNPAAFGEVGRQYISVQLPLQILKDSFTLKDVSLRFFSLQLSPFCSIIVLYQGIYLKQNKTKDPEKTLFYNWYYFNSWLSPVYFIYFFFFGAGD